MSINWTNSKGLQDMMQSLSNYLFKKSNIILKGEEGRGWVAILDLERHKGSNSQVHWYNPVLVTVLDKPAIKDIFRNFNMIRGLAEMKIYRNGIVDIID